MSLKLYAVNDGNSCGGDAPRIPGSRDTNSERPALLHRVTSAMERGALAVFAAETHLAKDA